MDHRGRDAAALMSYAALAERSSQVANWLRGLGARRGDRLLLMLGNIAPLWEVILAAMKLGVVIIPATTLLGPTTWPTGWPGRGPARGHRPRGRGRGHPGRLDADRGAPGLAGPRRGLVRSPNRAGRPRVHPGRGDQASDPLLLYFTSGTTAQPKLVEHTHASYPVGHLSTMYWIGLQPGDVHLNISSPGWAKHAWSTSSRRGTPAPPC